MRIFWHLFRKSASGKNTTAAMHRGSERFEGIFGECANARMREKIITLLSFRRKEESREMLRASA